MTDSTTDIPRKYRVGICCLGTIVTFCSLQTLSGANTSEEISSLRESSRASVGALREAMRAVRPGHTPREIQVRGVGGCVLNGAQGPALWADIRSSLGGEGADLDRRLQEDELVSLRMGCQHGGYRTEVSRTVPVGRGFSEEEGEFWNLLVEAFQAARALVRGGVAVLDVRRAYTSALRRPTLGSGLARDLLAEAQRGSGSELQFLRLEGQQRETEPDRLEAGTVVTMRTQVRLPQRLVEFQLGEILLVTEGGSELLSAGLPVKADEIDDFMTTDGYTPYVMGDVHNHLDPLPRHGLENLIRVMNIHGIAKSIIFRGRDKNSDYVLEAVARYPDRLIPSYRPNVYEIPEAWLANDPAVLAELEWELRSGKFRGVGEVNNVNVAADWMGPEAGLGERLLAVEVSPTSPMMVSLFRLARERNLFVNVHNEIYYYRELMDALKQFPDVTVLWSHGGGVDFYGLEIALKDHPNLHIDLSGLENSMFQDGERIQTAWREVIERYPDRFLVGYDDNSTTYEERPQAVEGMAKLLAQLSPSTARKVAIENMERILSGEDR